MTLYLSLAEFAGNLPVAWRWRISDGEQTLDERVVDLLEHPALGAWVDGTDEGARAEDEAGVQPGIEAGLEAFSESLAPFARFLTEKSADTPRYLVVTLPDQAKRLALLPLEQVMVAGKPLHAWGIRPVFQMDGRQRIGKSPVRTEGLRVLAVLSLPESASADNGRSESMALLETAGRIARDEGAGIDLRIMQYGATRDTLWRVLDDDLGWDLVLIALRGSAEHLVLESDAGGLDRIPLSRVAHFLRETASRLKLLVLTCASPPPRHAVQAREQSGLPAPDRTRDAPPAPVSLIPLPGLALELSRALDCAAVAMRAPAPFQRLVTFQRTLVHQLLGTRLDLWEAAHRATIQAFGGCGKAEDDFPRCGSVVVCGRNAPGLRLPHPRRVPAGETPPDRLQGCPPRPRRFAGRLKTMVRASLALAGGSSFRGVLFYGTVGAGKTTCARELVHRHDPHRFEDVVWFEVPPETSPDTAFVHFFHALETRLQVLGHPMTTASDDDEALEDHTLGRFGQVLERRSVLLVVDHLERLVDEKRNWTSGRWGRLFEVALSHDGPSRVVMTSRFMPRALKSHPAVRTEPIHALDLDETLLLLAELPAKTLVSSDADAQSERLAMLRMTQGHPYLLELAALASAQDGVLAKLFDAGFDTAGEPPGDSDQDAFLAHGTTAIGGRAFYETLIARQRILLEVAGDRAMVLIRILSRLHPDDREDRTLAAVLSALRSWEEDREADDAGAGAPPPRPRQAVEPLTAHTLPRVARELEALGLLHVLEDGDHGKPARYRVHPSTLAAAETGVALASRIDTVMARHWRDRVVAATKDSSPGAIVIIAKGLERATAYHVRARLWSEACDMLDAVLEANPTAAVVALALRLARPVAKGAAGSVLEAPASSVLAKALVLNSREEEAEQILREQVERSGRCGDLVGAARAAGVLADLLMASGRSIEAVTVLEERARWRREAGVDVEGTSGDRARRLEALEQAGAYDEVLGEVSKMLAEPAARHDGLDAGGDGDRETMLRTGKQAALECGQWGAALRLSDELVKHLRHRGASDVEVARVRMDDYWAVLKQRKDGYDEARTLLQGCRNVFQNENAVRDLARVFAALADLEDAVEHSAVATLLAQTGLRHAYQAGDVDTLTLLHANLAGYLLRRGASPDLALVHRLAAALLASQSRSRLLETILEDLAAGDLPDGVPKYEKLAAVLEENRAYRFRAIVENLSGPAATPQEALSDVWDRVQTRQRARQGVREAHADLIAGLPEAVREAFQLEGEAFADALDSALASLPEIEAGAIVETLVREGIVQPAGAPDMARTLQVLDPVLRGIAEVALGDRTQQPRLVADIMRLQNKGWEIGPAVQRIWAGERDPDTLTRGLDPNSTAVVKALLALIEVHDSPERGPSEP